MTEQKGREVGHSFYQAMRSGVLDNGMRRTLTVDSYAASALFLGLSSNFMPESRGVFMGGRVYDKVTQGDTVVFEGLSNWRNEIGAIIKNTGKIPLHGLALDLHNQDVAAGAGRAYLSALCSPVHIIEATKRVGDASVEEALFSLSLGHNVGLILSPEDFDDAIRYIDGKTNIYPKGLPAYWASLDIQREDLIRGPEQLDTWIKGQFNHLHPKNFRYRPVGQTQLNLMLHYVFNYSNLVDQDMTSFEAVVSDFSGANFQRI